MSDAEQVMWFNNEVTQYAGVADDTRRKMIRLAGQIDTLIGGTATGEDHVLQERLSHVGTEFGRMADDYADLSTRIRHCAEYLYERDRRGGPN